MRVDIATKVGEVLRQHRTTAEKLGANPGRKGVDGAWKMQVITDVRRAVGKSATLEEIAAYVNVSPSKISQYTDLENLFL